MVSLFYIDAVDPQEGTYLWVTYFEVSMHRKMKYKNMSPIELCQGVDGEGLRDLMNTIGDKWSIFLIVALAKAPNHRARFSELERNIPAISQKMLSATLKNLECDGLVKRELFPEVPPRVEYELTPLGLSLFGLMQGLVDWVSNNWESVKKARRSYAKA